MSVKFLLILVLIRDGTPLTTAYGYHAHTECVTSALSLAERAREAGHVVLSVDCYPVAPSWGLRL